jgi:hypothetical protein
MNWNFKIALLVLGLASVAAFAKDEPVYVIVPGQKIGDIRLGMTVNQVHSILGKPTGRDAATGKWWDFWDTKTAARADELEIRYDISNDEANHHRVTEVLVTSPAFKTTAGISTASSLKAIWSAFPNLKYVDVLSEESVPLIEIYDDKGKGISFEVIHKGKGHASSRTCYAIIVHKAGEEVQAMGTSQYPASGYNYPGK